jgi:hypothetical protein
LCHISLITSRMLSTVFVCLTDGVVPSDSPPTWVHFSSLSPPWHVPRTSYSTRFDHPSLTIDIWLSHICSYDFSLCYFAVNQVESCTKWKLCRKWNVCVMKVRPVFYAVNIVFVMKLMCV